MTVFLADYEFPLLLFIISDSRLSWKCAHVQIWDLSYKMCPSNGRFSNGTLESTVFFKAAVTEEIFWQLLHVNLPRTVSDVLQFLWQHIFDLPPSNHMICFVNKYATLPKPFVLRLTSSISRGFPCFFHSLPRIVKPPSSPFLFVAVFGTAYFTLDPLLPFCFSILLRFAAAIARTDSECLFVLPALRRTISMPASEIGRVCRCLRVYIHSVGIIWQPKWTVKYFTHIRALTLVFLP